MKKCVECEILVLKHEIHVGDVAFQINGSGRIRTRKKAAPLPAADRWEERTAKAEKPLPSGGPVGGGVGPHAPIAVLRCMIMWP